MKRLKLRRDDVCVDCGAALLAGTVAVWDNLARSVTCESCHDAIPVDVALSGPAPDRGIAGLSAQREYERRRAAREQRVRDHHPVLGDFLVWWRDAPQPETAWARGAAGERAVAESLARRTIDTPAAFLHDRRRQAGSKGNIDVLAVVPSGVYVVDAKDLSGKVRVESPLFGASKLRVAGRDRTKLIDGLDAQVAAVRAAVAPAIEVHGVLCFTARADLPLLGVSRMRGHLLTSPRGLAKRLNADGPLDAAAIDTLAVELAMTFPPAVT